MLIGNLTRDPELRYTPSGVAVCSFGLATNRRWTTKDGEQKDDAQFHRIVAWNKLAELCSQLLTKGARTYVEGRIQYREWTGSDNIKRQTTEIIIDDMVLLTSRQGVSEKTDLGADFDASGVKETVQEAPAEEDQTAGLPDDSSIRTADDQEVKETIKEKVKDQPKKEEKSAEDKEKVKEPSKDIPF